ncbi:MAG TPA: hypothetical protein ENJ18_01705 [Nannocystis exedens]|nr:hypothetical protein [Nannocystis exedens]
MRSCKPLSILLCTTVSCAAPPPEFEDPGIVIPDLGAAPSPWDQLPDNDRGQPPPLTTGGSGATTATGPTDPSTSTGNDPVADLQGLLLTEILPNPEGKDGGGSSPEFIEILNTTDKTLPLAELSILARGWPRIDAEEIGLEERQLDPAETLVLFRYSDLEEAPFSGVVHENSTLEVHFVTAAGLRNSDGAVILVGPEDEALDAIIYGGPPPPSHDFPGAWQGAAVAAPGSGESRCRIDPQDDTDSADDWIICAPSPGDPGDPGDLGEGGSTSGTDSDGTTGSTTTDTSTTGDFPVDATLVITEVLSNAPGPSAYERELEYVEILNLGPDDVDLDSWTIADALDIDAPGRDPLLYREGDGGCQPATCLAVGERALLVGGAYIGPIGDALVLETDDTTLADGGLTAHEPVVLRDADELIASTYRVWDDAYAEPYPIDTELPLHRQSPEAEDDPSSWNFDAPSPGLP